MMIERVAAAAKDALASLGWQLQRIDKEGRGCAIFVDGEDRQLILEIGLQYPPGSQNRDVQPGILLCYQEGRMPKILIPYQEEDGAPTLHWSSTADEIARATRAAIRNFESAFLTPLPDKRALYNHILDQGLKAHGVLDEALVQALRDAFAYDAATTVSWAERKLAILKERLREGAPVHVFDPAMKRSRTIAATDEFDAYAAFSFSRRE